MPRMTVYWGGREAESERATEEPANLSESDLNEPIPGDANGDYAREYYFADMVCSSTRNAKFDELQYTLSDSGNTLLHLNIPFVPFQHFQGSRAYREGFSYLEYLDVMRSTMTRHGNGLYELKQKWCARGSIQRAELPVWCQSSEVSKHHKQRKAQLLPHLLLYS